MGSFLVHRLLNDGWRVRVIDNLSSGKLTNLEDIVNDGNLEVDIYDLKRPRGL